MYEELIKFIEQELDFCKNYAEDKHTKELFFHNAFGAVLWESQRTGQDMDEFWEPYREEFIKTIEGRG